MVVFTCGHCGEAVNKPKVEKHYLTKCRNRSPNLSCMDCFKDFLGKDYESHTKCISEAQRYAAKGFVPKVNKGEAKQSAWVEMVQSVLEEQKGAPNAVRRIVEEISKHSNTPRKKPKFFNFVKNVCGHRTMPHDIEAAWDLISVKLNILSNANKQTGNNSQQNGTGPVSEVALNHTIMDVDPNKSGVDDIGEAETMEIEETKTKKQRKEERKRKKYENELQSAAVQATEEIIKVDMKILKKDKIRKKYVQENEVEDVRVNKKGKKRNINAQDEETTSGDGTSVNAVNHFKNAENKKLKLSKETLENCGKEHEELLSLHDQNIAAEQPARDKSDKFDWHGTILLLLQKKGSEMPYKRLQKKVLGEYMTVTGKEADDRIAEKLIKKLRSAPNVRVEKNRVVLVG